MSGGCCSVKVIKGINGKTPEIVDVDGVKYWFIDGQNTNVIATGEQGPQGPQGVQGVPGIGVSNIFISDGSTPIGGTVYPVNNVIVEYSNGIFFNAGSIAFVLTWNTMSLINGWTESVAASNPTPQYAIDINGFIHFRGVLDQNAASNGVFADLGSVLTSNTKRSVSSIVSNQTNADGAVNHQLFRLNASGTLEIVRSSEYRGPWFLTSVTPFYVMD